MADALFKSRRTLAPIGSQTVSTTHEPGKQGVGPKDKLFRWSLQAGKRVPMRPVVTRILTALAGWLLMAVPQVSARAVLQSEGRNVGFNQGIGFVDGHPECLRRSTGRRHLGNPTGRATKPTGQRQTTAGRVSAREEGGASGSYLRGPPVGSLIHVPAADGDRVALPRPGSLVRQDGSFSKLRPWLGPWGPRPARRHSFQEKWSLHFWSHG